MMNGTLEERLARERQLSPKEAVRIGASLAREVERLARSFGRIYRSRRRRASGIQGKYELSSSGLDEPVLGR